MVSYLCMSLNLSTKDLVCPAVSFYQARDCLRLGVAKVTPA